MNYSNCRIGFPLIALLTSAGSVHAVAPEVQAWIDHERLPGGQAAAMGGAMTALAEDWTAALYNPAALAWQRRAEFNLGYEGGSLARTMSVSTDGTEEKSTAGISNFSHVGYAHPLPAVRGGLCWGLGYARLADYTERGAFPDRDWRVSTDLSGEHDALVLSIAGQWTSQLAAGASLLLHRGRLEALEVEEDFAAGSSWRSWDQADMDGMSLRLGLLARQGPWRMGLNLEPPHHLLVDWTRRVETGDLGLPPSSVRREGSNYSIRIPALIALGTGYRTRFWQAGLSWDWQDWAATRYKELPAGYDISYTDQYLSRAFQARQRLRLGGEWTIPQTDLRLRAGAWWESPARSQTRLNATYLDENDSLRTYQYWDYKQINERMGFSGGASWLMEEAVALDLSVGYESWKQRWLEHAESGFSPSVIQQTMGSWRIQLAIAYRI